MIKYLPEQIKKDNMYRRVICIHLSAHVKSGQTTYESGNVF